jgi:two-component system, OmpR family, sensor histidine kinase TctE
LSGRGDYPSLGSRVLRHVMVPLALTWMVGAVVALAVAHFFTQKAFDRSLLDDAYLLASNVRLERGAVRLALTQHELETILYDPVETMHFSLTGPDGVRLAGESGIAMEPETGHFGHRFADIGFKGATLRAVTLHRDLPAPFDIVIAETQVGRTALLERLLLYSLAPQLLLLGLLAWWVMRQVQADLRPLVQLQQAVDNRHANELAPVEVPATTRDTVRLAGAINSLLQRLERSVRAQREFAGNVAHELRTPLAGIRALAEYGLAQKDPASWREQLERIASSQARASRLVDQLLDLALASEAEAGLQLGIVRLDDLVREAVLRFLPAADQAGVDLGARGIDGTVDVVGDATLIDGILNNLLDNALRYGTTGSRDLPAVTVAIEQAEHETVLSVLDNGSGLPGEEQMKMMQRGAQGDAGQLLGEGVGLGLALVAQYARLMGARMTLASGPNGVGWICRITFPRDAAVPETATATERPAAPAARAAPSAPLARNP